MGAVPELLPVRGRPRDPNAAVTAGRIQPADRQKRWSYGRQLLSFATIGLVLNLVYVGLYLLLRLAMGPTSANVVALVLSTLGDTALNRRVTFGVRNRTTVARHQLLGLVLLAVGLAVTSGSLWLLDAAAPSAGRVSEVVVLAAANLLVGLIRFWAFRTWMRPEAATPPPDAE
jgi:putative flippase GtrA